MSYLKIGSNWASSARRGRENAYRENQLEIRAAQMNHKAAILQQKNEMDTENHLNLIEQQANAITKGGRPEDFKAMTTIVEEADQKIKEQLEFYGDDFNAFMRGGGLKHIQEYRDSVLNSDRAKMIRANFNEVKSYLDASKSTPNLLSDRDTKNWQDYWDGKVDRFEYAGNYVPYTEPDNIGEYIERGLTPGHAYINTPLTKEQQESGEMDNFYKAAHNYNLDMFGNNVEQYIPPTQINQDELVNYINKAQMKKPMTENYQEQLLNYKGNSKKSSDQLINVFNMLDRGYQGDFNQYWDSVENQTARSNITSRFGGGSFNRVGDDKVYSTNIFTGKEKDIVSQLLGVDKESADKISPDQINNLLSQGNATIYDTDGNSLGVEQSLGIGWDENALNVQGIGFGFEVATDRDNNKFKLLTFDDVGAEGDDSDLNKNKAKDGVIFIKLKDTDYFGKDEHLYIKLDVAADNGANRVAHIINEATHEFEFSAKKTAETLLETPQYQHVTGEKFRFTPHNSVKAISSLHGEVENSLKLSGIKEPQIDSQAALMAHALTLSELYGEEESPSTFIKQIATSTDPTAVAAMDALKNNDSIGYIKAFQNAGELSVTDANTLLRNLNMIIAGYELIERQNKK